MKNQSIIANIFHTVKKESNHAFYKMKQHSEKHAAK